ncbi:MAG: tRNA pseudouridine(55) synthase TruB [Clostridiales bacterium]|nr:tRNA pseudouridine(55) synthase TruB [Clostridiales bacterium]
MTGIICIDKPKDITSFVAVAKVRRILSEKKAGHAGTLDPMATGVLPIFLGGATRFIELLPDHTKGYRADIKLGITTDTLDITGNVLKRTKADIKKEELAEAINSFCGDIMQTPPMYSAIQKDGVRLYELARKGIEIEREKRAVTISKIDLLGFDGENFTIDVVCSKGTYIRSLADDIGKKLGCGAVLTNLRRTIAAGFSLEESITIEELEKRKENPPLISVDEALKEYPKTEVTPKQAIRFSNGGELDLDRVKCEKKNGLFRVWGDGRFLGMGEADTQKGILKVKKVYMEV